MSYLQLVGPIYPTLRRRTDLSVGLNKKTAAICENMEMEFCEALHFDAAAHPFWVLDTLYEATGKALGHQPIGATDSSADELARQWPNGKPDLATLFGTKHIGSGRHDRIEYAKSTFYYGLMARKLFIEQLRDCNSKSAAIAGVSAELEQWANETGQKIPSSESSVRRLLKDFGCYNSCKPTGKQS